MKKITQNLRWLVTLLAMIVCAGAWAAEETFDFSAQNYTNQQEIGLVEATNFTVSFNKGTNSNTPKYYTTGTAIRAYGGNTFTVSSSNTITKITLTFGSGDGSNAISTDVGSFDSPDWTGSANSITFTIGGTSGHRRIKGITVTFNDGGTVTKTLTSIAISGTHQNQFYVGDTFNHEGAVVTATFSDNSTQDVTSQAEFTAPDMSTAGTKSVSVSYTKGDVTKTTSYDITVSAVALESIAISGNYPKEFEQGNTFSYEGAVVTATYNNGSTQDVTANATFTTPDMSTVGTQTVSVSYTENDVTKETSYNITIKKPFTPEDGVFDFTGTHDYGSGLSTTSDNQYYEEEDHTWTAGNVTLVTSGKYRWWNNANGNSLRLYDPSTLTLSVPKGNVITKVEISGDNTNYLSTENGTYSNSVWTGESQTVVLIKIGDKKPYISRIAVTYRLPVPSITVDPATVNATAEETEGTLALSYKNLSITDREDFGIQFYDANNVELTEEPDWVEVLVAEENGQYLVSYFMLDNEGEARTAYCKVFATGNDEFVYSNLITINQDEFVEPHEELTFVKVTSTDELVAGGEYIIIAHYPEDSEGYYAMTTTQNNNNRGADGISVSEDIAYIEPEHVQVITLEGDSEGWYFNTGDGYLYAASSNDNYLRTETTPDENAKATIGISSDGDATIVFQGNNSRNNLRFNNNNILFSCYASSSELPLVQLYKKVVEEEIISIGSAGYATYVTKNAVQFNDVKAYAVLAVGETSVALEPLTKAPANTPIIVEGTAGEHPCTIIESAEGPTVNCLSVSNGTVTGDGTTIYALANKEQGVGFYPVGNGITIPAGKAYLDTSSAKHHVKGFLALDGLTDAINNIAVENANGTIFNIAGQKVQNITKGGLYIVNGKKVIVK